MVKPRNLSGLIIFTGVSTPESWRGTPSSHPSVDGIFPWKSTIQRTRGYPHDELEPPICLHLFTVVVPYLRWFTHQVWCWKPCILPLLCGVVGVARDLVLVQRAQQRHPALHQLLEEKKSWENRWKRRLKNQYHSWMDGISLGFNSDISFKSIIVKWILKHFRWNQGFFLESVGV